MAQVTSDELCEYVLGTLPDARRRELGSALERSAELRRELAAVREALSALPASLPPVQPRAEARAALLAALDGGERFAPFLDDLARYFDLAKARVRELFSFIDEAARWQPGPLPGITLIDFAGGPDALGPDTGFARLPRGLRFPLHRHLGLEINYVLEGAVRNGDGVLYLPGEAIIMQPGSQHEFSIPDDRDALIAVIQDKFEILGPVTSG